MRGLGLFQGRKPEGRGALGDFAPRAFPCATDVFERELPASAVEIREFTEGDLEAVVAFSLRAWQPIFDSVRAVLGDDIFLRLHPDWKEGQAQSVRSICTNDERDVIA